MKVHLLYPDEDFDPARTLAPGVDDVIRDLGLEIVFEAMGAGDPFLRDVARQALAATVDDPATIRYRQAILADALHRPEVVREAYAIAVDAIEGERRIWGAASDHPGSVLGRAVRVLDLFVVHLRKLRTLADAHGAEVASDGLRRLLVMLAAELDDAYLRTVDDHLRRLRRDDVLMSARLGLANRGTGYVLRRPRHARRGWREWLGLPDRPSLTYEIAERDDAGARALGDLKGRGVALAAIALAQSADHILGFFRLLRAELGFYVGALNLHERLAGAGEATCFPEPLPAGRPALAATGIYDPCLALLGVERIVGNDVQADGRRLVMVTGANRGGKSTFLRSIGIAQLMMQAGMFVAARSFRADVRDRVLCHFRREEDASLRSGKLDEELGRMSVLVDRVTPASLVLLNESFASTNEREGSEIARQILAPLLDAGVKVVYVTHLYDLAAGLHGELGPDALFLRAERGPDGRRTFRLLEAEPLPTSFGADVYRRVFGADPPGAPTTDAAMGPVEGAAAAAGAVILPRRGLGGAIG